MGLEESLENFCDYGDKLWDSSFETGLPNASVCLQHTLLAWLPVAFFWLLLPLLIIQSSRNARRYVPLRRTTSFLLKVIVAAALALVSFAQFVATLFLDDKKAVQLLYPIFWTATWIAILATHELRLRCGLVSSGIVHLTSTLLVLFSIPEFYQWTRDLHDGNVESGTSAMMRCICFLIYFPLCLVHFCLMFFADRRRVSLKEAEKKCPELEASFFSRLTLWWFNPVPATGARKDLEIDDLFELNEGSSSEYLTACWNEVWQPRIYAYNQKKANWEPTEKHPTPPPPSIVAALFKIFKFEFLSATGLKVISDVLQFANPFLLNALIGFISREHAPLWQGIAFAVLMFTASEVRSFVLNSYFYIMFRMGIKFQTILTAATYQKTLKLSNAARREKTVGEIVNLMAIDVERYQFITPQIQQFWSCPFQITLALIYLFITLGYSAAPGILLMIIFVPLNIGASMFVRKWQMEQMRLKDERTKLINEMLNGIKVIKLYAWEVPMEEHIDEIRQRELGLIKKSGMVRVVLDSFNTASPFLVAIFSFATYTLTNHELTPQVAFVSLTLFNQLRSPMTMIAMLINQFVQAIVSNRRLKEFFVAEELDENAVDHDQDNKGMTKAVEMTDVSAAWDEEGDQLQDLSLQAAPGALLAVVGKVGAGKSSLISCLLGEMEKLKGYIGVRGRVAFVPQQSWIQNLTLRDNILFGKPFDAKRYSQVIHACALKPDLKILPHGDMTEIGEKGINLSGGQKARVALARAVYQEADVYLLDDPLSAVDAHVGRHIFDKVIGPNGLLRKKTRILVTHGLSFIKNAHTIIVLEDGRIAEQGTFSDLVSANGAFNAFLNEVKSKKETAEDGDESASSEGDLSNSDDEAELKTAIPLDSQVSVLTTQSVTIEDNSAKKLIQKEQVELGRVKTRVYFDYVKAATATLAFGFVGALTLFSVVQILRSFWLSAWSDDNDAAHSGTKTPLAIRLGVYGGLGGVESLLFLSAGLFNIFAGLSASRRLHQPLILNLLHSPMAFFDTTPLGRILNRCSKDIEVVDTLLAMNFRYFVMCILQVLTALVVIAISTPLFIAVVIPLAGIYLWFLKYYVPTSRQLKRLESINRSPIYSHFGESIQGAASIRAFGRVEAFEAKSAHSVDRFIRCKYTNIVSNRWLAVRLEFVGNCVIFFAALFAALSKAWGWSTSAGVVGVSVSYALTTTEVLNFAVRQISELEANIVSVERIKEYLSTPNEAAWITEKRPPKDWPQRGEVEFDNYATRYREGLDLVVKNMSAKIRAGEKIGIVGRTGAGKSSLALALFRMIEPANGRIVVDQQDVSELGLHDLRSSLTIIPQDPVLFSGTLRFNLDPFAKYGDAELWKALDLSHLRDMVDKTDKGLDHVIAEGGENISVGQRQLVCLARALLRRTKILVLDEATAAVDLYTDTLIQKTIREQFDDCTVFTIAHRLNTILDYDRIMVLSQGEIIEFAPPDDLLADKASAFARMVADAKQHDQTD